MTTKTALNPDNFVCPQCGGVYTNGKLLCIANSVSYWTQQGYHVEKCYYCKQKEKRNVQN